MFPQQVEGAGIQKGEMRVEVGMQQDSMFFYQLNVLSFSEYKDGLRGKVRTRGIKAFATHPPGAKINVACRVNPDIGSSVVMKKRGQKSKCGEPGLEIGRTTGVQMGKVVESLIDKTRTVSCGQDPVTAEVPMTLVHQNAIVVTAGVAAHTTIVDPFKKRWCSDDHAHQRGHHTYGQ